MLLLLFIYSQLSDNNKNFNKRYTKLRNIYLKYNQNKTIWPEGGVFGIAWTILYALIFSSFMVYMWNLAPNNDSLIFTNYFNYWDATMFMFIFNIIFNKIWSLVFMNGSIESMDYIIVKEELKKTNILKPNTISLSLGVVIILLLIISGIVIEVLLCLQNQWIAFGLYVPYILWLIYALILNISVMDFINNMIRHFSSSSSSSSPPSSLTLL